MEWLFNGLIWVVWFKILFVVGIIGLLWFTIGWKFIWFRKKKEDKNGQEH